MLTQSKSSDRVFFTKTEDHNYFEQDIFHNNLKDNYGQIYY